MIIYCISLKMMPSLRLRQHAYQIGIIAVEEDFTAMQKQIVVQLRFCAFHALKGTEAL